MLYSLKVFSRQYQKILRKLTNLVDIEKLNFLRLKINTVLPKIESDNLLFFDVFL